MKRVTGIWDLARLRGSLGTLLILLEELEIQRWIHGEDVVDVVIELKWTDFTAMKSAVATGSHWTNASP